MNITVTDTALLTPTGGIASNTPIKIVCLEGYDQVLTGAISEFTTDDAGAYSFPLYYGVHAIYVRFDTKFKLLGKVTITSELADTATISDLLLYTEPMLPDEIALVSGLVEEARGYAEDAETAAIQAGERLASYEAESTEYLINTFDSSSLVEGDIVKTLGFQQGWAALAGSAGGGAVWVKSSETGSASQSPSDMQTGTLTTSNGDVFVLSGEADVMKFGAIGDGVDTGAEFTGTDNREAFYAALEYCSLNRKELIIPNFVFRIGYIYTGTNKTSLTLNNSYYVIRGSGTLLIDDDLVDSNGLDYCFGNSSLTTASDIRDKNTYERFEVRGISFQSRWSHSGGRRGIRPISVGGFSKVIIKDCEFYDIRNKGAIGYSNAHVNISDNIAFRCAPGAFRMQESSNVIATHNYIKDGADDSLDFHTSNYLEDQGPSRSSIIVTNNLLEKTEGIVCLGAKFTVVSNNVLKLTQGNQIAVGTGTFVEGDTAAVGIIVTNNVISDPIEALVEGETVLPDYKTNQGCIYIGTAMATGESTEDGVRPGDYNSITGEFVLPWDNSGTTPSWGATYTGTLGDLSIAKGRSMIVSGNVIMRTLPSVDLYSEWGMGDYFEFNGWEDVSVTDDNFRGNGVVLLGDVIGASITNNQISDLPYCGIYFRGDVSEDRTKCFRDIKVSDNTFTNLQYGANKDNQGVSAFEDYDDWTIEFSGNSFDLDPYHLSDLRTQPLDGTWQSSGSLRYSAILMRAAKNITVKDNSFANCYVPIQGNSNYQTQFITDGNVVRCDPVNVVYNALNKGVAVPLYGGNNNHVIIECDPTAAEYGKLQNMPLFSSTSYPSDGKYVAGHVIRNLGGSTIYGWRRMTTGDAHVLNTDWVEIG